MLGNTNRSVTERFKTTDLDLIEVVETIKFQLGREAIELEQLYLKEYSSFAYDGTDILSSENTELFTSDVLSLDS